MSFECGWKFTYLTALLSSECRCRAASFHNLANSLVEGRSARLSPFARVSLLAAAVGWLGIQPLRCQVTPAEQLTIKVEQGEGDVHRPGDPGTAITVVVTNEFNIAQPGASVSFTAPQVASACLPTASKSPATSSKALTIREKCVPSVVLGNSQTSVRKLADADGKVEIQGVIGNNIKGAVPIRVGALFQDRIGTGTVNQVIAGGPFWTRKKIGIFSAVIGTTAIILYEVFKPGPPSVTINSPTATTVTPQAAAPILQFQIGK